MKFKKIVGITSLAAAFIAITMSVPAVAKDKLPEVDSDGLHLIKDRKVFAAYAKPGVDLSTYNKVMLLDCFVSFKKDWQKDYNMDQIGLSGRIRDKDADDIMKRLAEEFSKEFNKVLAKEGYPVVTEAGPDVLLLRPALINVDVLAPDLQATMGQRVLVNSAGGMTLYLELYDSATSTLIARVVDPQADDTMAHVANRVSNKAAADRILRSWAELLTKHLGETKQ